MTSCRIKNERTSDGSGTFVFVDIACKRGRYLAFIDYLGGVGCTGANGSGEGGVAGVVDAYLRMRKLYVLG